MTNTYLHKRFMSLISAPLCMVGDYFMENAAIQQNMYAWPEKNPDMWWGDICDVIIWTYIPHHQTFVRAL